MTALFVLSVFHKNGFCDPPEVPYDELMHAQDPNQFDFYQNIVTSDSGELTILGFKHYTPSGPNSPAFIDAKVQESGSSIQGFQPPPANSSEQWSDIKTQDTVNNAGYYRQPYTFTVGATGYELRFRNISYEVRYKRRTVSGYNPNTGERYWTTWSQYFIPDGGQHTTRLREFTIGEGLFGI